MVVVVEVHGTGAGPRAGGDGGSGEQAGPGVEGARQLHATGAVARKRVVSGSSSSFPDVLDGLRSGHLSRILNHRDTPEGTHASVHGNLTGKQ